MAKTVFVRAIVTTLKAAGIEEIISKIKVNTTNINAYLTIAEQNYPDIDAILASTKSAKQIHAILKAIANANNVKLFKLVRARMLPEYTKEIYNRLNESNIDIEMSCEMLQSHIKEANRVFPETDIAATLVLMESPFAIKQAIDSIISCDNDKLKQYLEYVEDTYLSA